MKDWQKIFEIPELKEKLIESTNEVLDEVVLQYMKKFELKKKGQQSDEEEEKLELKNEEDKDNNNEDLFYFSKEEKCYKVFNPRKKQWSAQSNKPSVAQVEALREIADQLKKEEEELVKQIHHDIAGEDGDPELDKQSSLKQQLQVEEEQ